MTGTVVQETKDDRKEEIGNVNTGDLSSFYRVDMTGGLGYDLGDGNEKKKHKDIVHDVYFSSLRWTGNLRDQVQNVVFAMGVNEFGRFVSVGWLRVGNRVTLARRYVDEEDQRAKWDIVDLRKAVFDQIAVGEVDGHVQIRIPPWQCAAMHADAGQISKRQRLTKDDAA